MKVVAIVIVSALLTIFGLVRLALGVVPTTLDLVLECDPRPATEQVIAYKFFERQGTNWLLLGTMATNRITISNVIVLLPHTYGVSASNVLGESDISAPYIAPTDPHPPLKLRAGPTNSLVLESSLDGGGTWRVSAIIADNPVPLLRQRTELIRSSRTNSPPIP